MEKNRALARVKLGKKEDPVELAMRLALIVQRYKTPTYTIPDNEIMVAMMNAVPDKYAGVISAAQEQHGDALDSDTLEAKLHAHWRARYGDENLKTKDDDSDNEGNKGQCQKAF